MEVQCTSAELTVCQALRAATDPNHEVVRKAECQLAEWESEPGFILTLAHLCLGVPSAIDVTINNQLDGSVRWMATIYLKNCVNKYWRRNARNELPAHEKKQIRDLLLAHFTNETVSQILLQKAVLMARIARLDCPAEWPDLIPELLKRLEALSIKYAYNRYDKTDDQQGQHILLTLHHIVKALASRRSIADKRTFEDLSSSMYEFIYQLWQVHSNKFFHQLKCDDSLAIAILERTILCARILRKLTIYGFGKLQKSSLCVRYIDNLFDCLMHCLYCRYELRQMRANEQLISLLENLILKQIKTIVEFQGSHRVTFQLFTPRALQFSFNHVFHCHAYLIHSNNVIDFPQFAIHCINMIKGSLSPFYWVSKCDDGDSGEALNNYLEEFFTNERIHYICEKIITHYFLLTQAELELWSEYPEEFAQDDHAGDSWKYSLRPCIESLFLTYFASYQTQMSTEVAKYIYKAQQMQLTSNSDLKDILLKDAIYNAAGRAALHLFNEVDFDSWFSGQLLDELKIENSHFRILRRRIIWLLGEWAGVKFCRGLRPLGYEACLHLLRPTEDISIKLAASCTLSILVSDFEFSGEAFLPYLDLSFNALFNLLCEAKECDTKMKVLTVMSSLVEKMSYYIERQADNLISYLPMLWKESENFNMLRCSIICTLEQMVKAIGDIPDRMRPFLYNVIAYSTDVKEPAHIYLIAESLSLWINVVENTTSMSLPLIDLCCNIMPIIEMSSENLRRVLLLIQAYILLDAHAFLDRYGKPFIEFCIRIFDDIRAEGIILIMKVFEICLKSDANYGLEMIKPTLPYIFRQVQNDRDFLSSTSMFLTIIARVLLINQQVFMEIVRDMQNPEALGTILDIWIERVPFISELEKRKLFCLAFLSIFSNNTVLLERFPAILRNITRTLDEIMCLDDDSNDICNINTSDAQLVKRDSFKYCDSLVYDDICDWDISKHRSYNDFDCKTHHYDRCRQLALKDPVHKISLPQYVECQLNNLRSQLGDTAYKQLMGNVGKDVLERLNQYVPLQLNLPD